MKRFHDGRFVQAADDPIILDDRQLGNIVLLEKLDGKFQLILRLHGNQRRQHFLLTERIIGVSSFFAADYWCQRIIGISSFFAEKRTDTNNPPKPKR
jgi:hypothetical protein